jgi:hypothetical protein
VRQGFLSHNSREMGALGIEGFLEVENQEDMGEEVRVDCFGERGGS